MRWNSEEIISQLQKLGYADVSNSGQGGDYDTDHICVKIPDTGQRIFICGFNTDDIPIETPDDYDVELLEITDGLDSLGGLNSRLYKTAKAYIDIRQFFIDKYDIGIVDSMEQYF